MAKILQFPGPKKTAATPVKATPQKKARRFASPRRLTPKQEWLLIENFDIIGAQARRLMKSLPPSYEYDDLFQAGSIAMMRAIQTWDKKKGSLRMWLEYKVRGGILDSVKRKVWRESNNLPLTEAIQVQAVEPPKADEFTAARVKLAMSKLEEREQRIVMAIYWEGRTTSELAEELEMSPSNVSRLHRRALAELSTSLGGASLDFLTERTEAPVQQIAA